MCSAGGFCDKFNDFVICWFIDILGLFDVFGHVGSAILGFDLIDLSFIFDVRFGNCSDYLKDLRLRLFFLKTLLGFAR